jgi:hypothetical protein
MLSPAAADLSGSAYAAGIIVYRLVLGGLLGVAIGRLGATALWHIALTATGLYPLATLTFAAYARNSPRTHGFGERGTERPTLVDSCAGQYR